MLGVRRGRRNMNALLSRTPLYPAFEKRIRDRIDWVIQDKVTPWVFMTAGPPFKMQTFHGKEISYQGIKFEGPPCLVFWGHFIEPFLEDIIVAEIDSAVKLAHERRVNLQELLSEIRTLLQADIARVYAKMADVDRRLRGEGFPQRVAPKVVDGFISSMMKLVDDRIQAEIAMWKPGRRWDKWYENNKFLVWLIGTIVALCSILLKFF